MNKEMKKHIEQRIRAQNNRQIPDFEGYSPLEMQSLLHDPFGPNSPINLLRLTDHEYRAIPMLSQVKYLAGLIDAQGELKLTSKGFLPPKVVSDIYAQRFIKDEAIELGISKLYKETDSLTVYLTRILLELSGLAKKRNNKLSLTKAGKIEILDNFTLFQLIFETFMFKYNWSHFDGYGQNNIGQFGFGFTLTLLGKYGHEKRPASFYADKYFTAFPHLVNEPKVSGVGTTDSSDSRCYSLRTFDRFLDFFGLIAIDSEKKWNSVKYITTTKLFDSFIAVCPPQSAVKGLASAS